MRMFWMVAGLALVLTVALPAHAAPACNQPVCAPPVNPHVCLPGQTCIAPVDYAMYVAWKIPHCQAYDWHYGPPQPSVDPVLGVIEVDPDNCYRDILPIQW